MHPINKYIDHKIQLRSNVPYRVYNSIHGRPSLLSDIPAFSLIIIVVLPLKVCNRNSICILQDTTTALRARNEHAENMLKDVCVAKYEQLTAKCRFMNLPKLERLHEFAESMLAEKETDFAVLKSSRL